ncbi:MAG: aminoglycoside phosphotransferase family protein [Acidimicrobiales bacterium]
MLRGWARCPSSSPERPAGGRSWSGNRSTRAWRRGRRRPPRRRVPTWCSSSRSRTTKRARRRRRWRRGGSGAAELLDADESDQALLLRRVHPGTRLVDASLAVEEHLVAGADVLRRLGAVEVGPGLFPDLAAVAGEVADATEERAARLAPTAPYPLDVGLVAHAVRLLRSLPAGADRVGLAHGDLNPGNVLRSDANGWLAIDPKPVWGDLAWDPWPLLTQVGDWVDVVAQPPDLVARTRLVADGVGLDPARVAAWCTARSVTSGLWAADRGWWTGFRGADGDLARALAWSRATGLLSA